jgi:hypothetical protein
MNHQPIYRLVETSPPAIEPLTLDETKTFLRVDQTSDDSLIDALITAARMFCEGYTGRSLITRSYSLYADRWPGARLIKPFSAERGRLRPVADAIELPYPPLLSITQINIYAADNSSCAFDAGSYFVDTAGARIVLNEGAVPPLPLRVVNGIEVQYTAGYGAAEDDVPALLRQGILQLIGYLYENRGDTPAEALFTSGAAALFQPYRVMSLS